MNWMKLVMLYFMDLMQAKINIVEITDIKHVKLYDGMMVIVIAQEKSDYDNMSIRLKELGYTENLTFFQSEIFQNIYYLYKLDLLWLDYVELTVTEKCTLHCQYCCLFMPYYEKPKDIPYTTILEELDTLFSKVDLIKRVRILGGEPLLYSELYKVLDYFGKKYRKRVDYLYIVTNGTVKRNPEVMNMCKKYDITILISDYSANVDYRNRLCDIKKIFQSNQVKYVCKPVDGLWFDVGFPHNIKLDTNEERLKVKFNDCATYCRAFYNKRLYYCALEASAVRA